MLNTFYAGAAGGDKSWPRMGYRRRAHRHDAQRMSFRATSHNTAPRPVNAATPATRRSPPWHGRIRRRYYASYSFSPLYDHFAYRSTYLSRTPITLASMSAETEDASSPPILSPDARRPSRRSPRFGRATDASFRARCTPMPPVVAAGDAT